MIRNIAEKYLLLGCGALVVWILFLSFIVFCFAKVCSRRRPRISPDNAHCGSSNSYNKYQHAQIPTISNGLSQNCDNVSLPREDQLELACPICFEIPLPPKKIYQCSQGHTICDECLNKLQGVYIY